MIDFLKAIEQTRRYPSLADVYKEDEEYSSSSDASDATQGNLDTIRYLRFRKTIESIFEGMCSLYRISALLRRPRNSSKYLRSSNSTIPSHDTLEATPDYAHVSEKLRHWRYLTKQSTVGGDEKHAPIEEGVQSQKEDGQREIADIAFFCQRLTWANLSRRKRLDLD